MSCPYYYYNYNSYACRKINKDVNEDTYYKYCRTYSYDSCPIYKGNDTSGCFLTSACVEAKGLADDCRELTILREFRDSYLKSTPEGASDICEYYHTAPAIVEKIKDKSDAKETFARIYEELVLPCVTLIEAGKLTEAHSAYKEYTRRLQKQYL